MAYLGDREIVFMARVEVIDEEDYVNDVYYDHRIFYETDDAERAADTLWSDVKRGKYDDMLHGNDYCHLNVCIQAIFKEDWSTFYFFYDKDVIEQDIMDQMYL